MEPQNLYVKQQATEWFHSVIFVIYQRCRALIYSLFSLFLLRSCDSFTHSIYCVSSIIFAIYSILSMKYLTVGAAMTYVLTVTIVSSVQFDQVKKDLIATQLFQIILQTMIEFSHYLFLFQEYLNLLYLNMMMVHHGDLQKVRIIEHKITWCS